MRMSRSSTILRAYTWSLHLTATGLPSLRLGSMHLTKGSGGNRARLEFRKTLPSTLPSCGRNYGFDFLTGKRLHSVLEPDECLQIGYGKQARPRGKELPQLDEGGRPIFSIKI